LKDLGARAFNVFHRSVFRASKGRVFGSFSGMPVVDLTTTGRKSGQPRTVMLTSPVKHEGHLVLVASYGGDEHHPAWFLNLEANPDVVVTAEGEADQPLRARVATPAEKAELWPQVTDTYKGYAGYQRRTDRDIPLVILEPRPDPA
jgi:deazaflavin-dependent oxidoreductase (nitroreductase family)